MSDPKTYPVIAIDGPAASGKSSVSKLLSQKLGFNHVDTGAMYRAITWRLLELGINAGNTEEVAEAVEKVDLDYDLVDGSLQQRLDGQDPTLFTKADHVSSNVSSVAKVPQVRALLVSGQRDLAKKGPLVMEGRDIGSVVFSDSPYKFYIDADPEVRAQRRAAEGSADAIKERDRVDSTRKNAPLVVAEDADVIDSTHLTLDEVVRQLLASLQEKGMNVKG